ncbi:YciI family protein [Actinoplanes sp. NPDC026619]|uniref:YciI family protein n=1 Tax=Actinoplanes sp. NPDC026619 TaxID=3155798 RepID=UPI0033ECF580
MPVSKKDGGFGRMSFGADRHSGKSAERRNTVRYVMIIAGEEDGWFDEAVSSGLMDEVNAWWEKWYAAGKIVKGGAELQPASTAKTVSRGGDGQPTVTDGPYLELKEVVGGFIILEGEDIDDAIAVASGWPGIVPLGDRVEVRPVMER